MKARWALLISMTITIITMLLAVFIAKAADQETMRQAKRSDYQEQLTLPPTPPPTGLNGLPFAPEGLSNCEEMKFYRVQAGLPDIFDKFGWRESNCRNEEGVRTYCCWGYWQLYVSLHLKDHRIEDPYNACGVFSRFDIDSDEPLDKQRQACATKALLEVQGLGAWDL